MQIQIHTNLNADSNPVRQLWMRWKNAEKYAVFKGKNHEGNVRGGNLHKERENIYKQQGTLKEIIT